MVRWEEGKKWQKKVETLRTRLTEKQRELEGAHKSLQALKDTLTRYSCGQTPPLTVLYSHIHV